MEVPCTRNIAGSPLLSGPCRAGEPNDLLHEFLVGHSVVDHRFAGQRVEQEPGNQLVDHPACQARGNGSSEQITRPVCRLDARCDLLDPPARSSLDSHPGELAPLHEAAKNKAEEEMSLVVGRSCQDVGHQIADQKHQRCRGWLQRFQGAAMSAPSLLKQDI